MLVTEVATPTTVSFGLPGTPASVITTPRPTLAPDPVSARLRETTTCPVAVAQCPDDSTTSSTGPPAEDRPASVNAWNTTPGVSGTAADALTVASANGPAAAVTPASRAVAASAPDAAVPRVHGERGIRAVLRRERMVERRVRGHQQRQAASVEAAAEASRTSPMASACTRRPASPPRRAVRIALMPAPRHRAASCRDDPAVHDAG